MSVLLPRYPGPSSASPAYLDWGGTLSPIFGGSVQKLLRLGDRFAIDVTMPPLPAADLGRIWVSRLIQAQREGALFPWPQLDFVVGAPGSAKVDGGGQAGSVLVLKGLTPGYSVREGQFFSIVHGGRRYLHFAKSGMTAAGEGTLSLPIAPMLRMRPDDGDICEFAVPMIEGFLDGDSRQWTLNVARYVGLSFRIMEAK